MIELSDVSRRYGDVAAVKNITFSMTRGEVLGLLGTNGAGKSTTLKMIAGCLTPSAGRITIAGEDITVRPVAAKKHIGYLPDTAPLYRDATVDEYLRYCARLRGVSGRRLSAALADAKERCGLSAVGRCLIKQLSTGYRQRIGIAQAIIHDPGVIILDEPTVGLDPVQIQQIRKLIKALGADKCVLLSTHILAEVQTLCDRVCILQEGKLVLDERLARQSAGASPYWIVLGLKRLPGLECLLRSTGVLSAERLSGYSYRVQVRDDEARDRLIKQAVNSDWELIELGCGSTGLEERFVRLIAGETAMPEGALT